ncbi:hypothetical protein [Variovorax paradoxus]|uniref:hypothetical protein n=1 Tax=Variovorax paradoxus TaxID=34073 RepID=UPI0019335AD5|nr:hypothetical protein INQ48_18270 [Variovorax paradoxus]
MKQTYIFLAVIAWVFVVAIAFGFLMLSEPWRTLHFKATALFFLMMAPLVALAAWKDFEAHSSRGKGKK